MKSNKIIFSVVLYFIILAIISIVYFNEDFTSSDAAGNGMAKGLTQFYCLAIIFITAIIITIINSFFLKDITKTWGYVAFLLPILSLIIIAVIYYEPVPEKKEFYTLKLQIRTKEKLKNGNIQIKNSRGGGSGSKLFRMEDNGYYIYKTPYPFTFYKDNLTFYIKSDKYEIAKFNLKTPYKPDNKPLTNWQTLYGIDKNTLDTIQLEFRYEYSKLE